MSVDIIPDGVQLCDLFVHSNHLQIDGLYEFYKHEIRMRDGKL